MRKGWRLAEVPFPTALASERFGKIGQIRCFIWRDYFGFHAFAVVAEERLGNGVADVFMGNTRQQFDQIGDAPAYGGDPFGL